VAAIDKVPRDMIDDHRLAGNANLVADRGFDLELAARLQAEGDLVAHRAGDPAVLGDPGDGGKAHAGGAADDLEDGGHRVDRRDRAERAERAVNILRQALRPSSVAVQP
jgi:hypothetical protein